MMDSWVSSNFRICDQFQKLMVMVVVVVMSLVLAIDVHPVSLVDFSAFTFKKHHHLHLSGLGLSAEWH